VIAVVVIGGVAVLYGGLAAVLFHGRRQPDVASDVVTERLRRRVIVTIKTGEAFAGVLFAADHTALVLRETTALAYGPKSEHVAVDGEALILLADVAYLQLP
jgi:small nuclear ribonucleoprotein (snRNP)-like protein